MTTLQHPAPTFEDVWRMSQETERKFQETDRKFQETDRMFQETKRFIREISVETDRKHQETRQLMKENAAEMDLVLKKLSKNLGDIGNRLGEFVEHSVAPAVVRLFQSQGVEVHEVHPSVEVNRDGEGIEIDLLVVNDGSLVAVECKSKLTQEHVDEHIQRMEKLKRLLPAYRNHRAFGAVATMVMSESVKNYALSKGFYVLYQNGENVEVSNPAGFTPTLW